MGFSFILRMGRDDSRKDTTLVWIVFLVASKPVNTGWLAVISFCSGGSYCGVWMGEAVNVHLLPAYLCILGPVAQ